MPVQKESSTTFKADKIALMKKVRDFTTMTDKLNRVLRAAEATCGDSILHNAACGDKESKNKILDKPEDYFHNVAIAGHVSLLNAIIDQDLIWSTFPMLSPVQHLSSMLRGVAGPLV